MKAWEAAQQRADAEAATAGCGKGSGEESSGGRRRRSMARDLGGVQQR